MVRKYIPSRGDIVSIQFNPQAGKEQFGWRPALIISPSKYNKKVGLAVMCPITKKKKGYPFEIELPDKLSTEGVVLADHVKNLDWGSRGAKFIETVPKSVLGEVVGKLRVLIGMDD